jgi:hypothetical protein
MGNACATGPQFADTFEMQPDLLDFGLILNKKIMKRRKKLLLFDAIVNLILGVLLVAYSPGLAGIFGVPEAESAFYPNILGGVLIGIGLALLIESYIRDPKFTSGLGLTGAICINLCGGIVLLFWLITGSLNLPLKGMVFLWSLDILLLAISCLELMNHLRLRG